MAEANFNSSTYPMHSTRKKFEFSEKDKKLITKALSLILSKTDQKVTSFQFDNNIAVLSYNEYDCEYFNLSEYGDTEEEELDKVQYDLNI